MNEQWNSLMDRIDALSARERFFLMLSILTCVIAVVDLLWLTPAQTAFKQLTQRFAAQNADLSRLRDELRGLTAVPDPSRAVREDIAAQEARLAAVNAHIQELLPAAKGGPALEQVLMQLLRKQDGLVLVGLRTLGDAAAPAAAAAPNAASGGLPNGMTKRGLELQVSGPYPELVRYIKTLETALPSLRWGTLTLSSDKLPPLMTVQVFVVGVQP